MIEPTFEVTRNTKMLERVAFYIPSRTASGKDEYDGIVHDDLVRVVTNFLTFEFGGATVVQALGFYVHEVNLRVQDEKVIVAYAFGTTDLVGQHRNTIEALANDLCCRFDQTAVAFEIGGAMYLAAPTSKYRSLSQHIFEKLKKGTASPMPVWGKYMDMAKLIENRKGERQKASA